MTSRILVASPIRQSPAVLRLFLVSLARLAGRATEISYCFIDDNDNEESRELLAGFAEFHAGRAEIIEAGASADPYVRDEYTHRWHESILWRVADHKNRFIRRALDEGYDGLFLADSDVMVHPDTIEKLLEADKPIVSEIFWTKWQPNTIPMPQVWMCDEYTMFERRGDEKLTKEQEMLRMFEFIGKLRYPGVYEVGGLGACTLIRREALEGGVNFNRIRNVSFWGEDRHFCIRAQALGFSLHVDTHYPALHCYRESDLPEAATWVLQHAQADDEKEAALQAALPARSEIRLHPSGGEARPRLTLSMVVRNEAEKFLALVLGKHREYIDDAVIIDDGSDDESAEICREQLRGIPLRLIRNETSRFGNEVELRKQQWNETLATNPEWILNMDADEMFEDRFASGVHAMLREATGDVGCFRLYDMWSATHYRDDQYWQAHASYRPMLLRYRPSFAYAWREQPLHCGRFPSNIFEMPSFIQSYRVKHLGWSTPEIRSQKHDRYMTMDPGGRYGWHEQYLSILDPSPKLSAWEE